MTTWVKVYNSMPAHPKFIGIGPQAGWLFVCGLCYANEHLTDGFIPANSLHVVAPSLSRPRPLAVRLVSAGLWLDVTNGWQIHDYCEHQRSAAEIRDRRRKDRERKGSAKSDPEISARNPRGIRTESKPTPQGIRDLDVEIETDVEVEKKNTNVEPRSTVLSCFTYWQEKCGHPQAKLTTDRRRKIAARLREGYTEADIRKAIDGAARAAFVNDDGKRFDDIELICRSGSKLESFMARADASVVALNGQSKRSPALEHMDRWKNYYPDEETA